MATPTNIEALGCPLSGYHKANKSECSCDTAFIKKFWQNYLGDYKIMSRAYEIDSRTATSVDPRADSSIPLNELSESLVMRTNSINIRLGDIIDSISGNSQSPNCASQPCNASLQSRLIETGYNLNTIEERLNGIEQLLGINRNVGQAKSVR